MTSLLDRLAATGALTPFDVHFGRAVARLGGDGDKRVAIGAAAANHATTAGHVCIDLASLAGKPAIVAAEGDEEPPAWPDLRGWGDALWAADAAGDGERPTPLVLDRSDRLYLTRYWRYEDDLARRLLGRAGERAEGVDGALLAAGLERLFGPAGDSADPQRLAAATAVLRRLTVISGGPGTGKTTTVVRILTLLADQARRLGQPAPRVRLAAPTGKAAARLSESIRDALARSEGADLPREASTIHRLLRPRWDAPNRFVHGPDDPLPADVVVVDETSMVDLALLSKLVAAVPDRARLILLGDRDQLASVEAGAVLGDVCNTGHEIHRSGGFAAELARVTGQPVPGRPREGDASGLGDCVVQLTRSYRFGPDSGIGRLAAAINGGDAEAALALLRDPAVSDVSWVEVTEDDAVNAAVAPFVRRGYATYLDAGGAVARLEALGRFRVLCAHRRGPGSVEALNALAEAEFARSGALRPDATWYPGRPVLVGANDHALRLFNGDLGVISQAQDGGLEAVFPEVDGTTRALSPARLPPHETVFAATVHRSQGSEVDEVLVILPLRPSPVATRELLYTAVTRARRSVRICASVAAIQGAVERTLARSSGLRDRLWEASG